MEKINTRLILNELSEYIPGMSEEELQEKIGKKRIVKLASNENPWGPSKQAVQAMQNEALRVHRYPRGDAPALRKILAKNLEISENSLVFGNGSDEMLLLIAMAFLNPNDEVLVPSPSFSEYRFAATVMDAQTVSISLQDMNQNLEAFLQAITPKTKVIFLCNPNNPTGTWISTQEMKPFLKSVPKNVLVVVDQAYAEFSDDPNYPNLFEEVKTQKNLILLRTFSKAWGLAGLRIGYSISHPELAKMLEKVRAPFNVNRMAQAAAVASLQNKEHFEKGLKENQKEREFMGMSLQKLGFEILPSQANFLAMKVGKQASSLVEFLLNQGVIVRHLKSFGLEDWIRVSIGLPEENAIFLENLSLWIQKGNV